MKKQRRPLKGGGGNNSGGGNSGGNSGGNVGVGNSVVGNGDKLINKCSGFYNFASSITYFMWRLSAFIIFIFIIITIWLFTILSEKLTEDDIRKATEARNIVLSIEIVMFILHLLVIFLVSWDTCDNGLVYFLFLMNVASYIRLLTPHHRNIIIYIIYPPSDQNGDDEDEDEDEDN